VNNRIVISWQSYLLFSIISVLAVPLALVKQLSFDRFPFFCGIGLGVTLATGLIIFGTIFVMKPFVKDRSGREQELISIGLLVFAGTLRGVLLYNSIELFDLKQPTDFFTRIWTSTTTTVLWLTGISIVITSRSTFIEDYKAMLRKALIALSLQTRQVTSGPLPPHIESEFVEIEEFLSKAVIDEDLPRSKEAMLFAAAELKIFIEDKIRPLSHRLWIESAATTPKIKIGNSLASSVRHLSLPPFPLTLFLALATTLNVGSSLTWQRGLFSAFVIFLELFPLLAFYQKKIRSRIAGKILPSVVLLLVPGTILSVTFYLSNRFVFKDDVGALNFIFIPLFILASIPASTFTIVNQDRNQLLSRIEESIRQINPVSELMTHQINADVASYLHNSLQSQLLAIAGQMEISAQNLDEDEFRKNFDLLKVSLENPLRQDFSHFMNNPRPRLNRLESAWRGIANVKITIGEEVLQNHNRNILITQLIEESIANAVRHSNAKTILVSAQLVQDGSVHLTVQNDGESIPTTNNGIGTAWLDHFAPNSWNRIHSESGTQLEITLP